MDKFSISDQFYHELSMVLPSLPRSYKVKQERTALNKSLRAEIKRVPAPHHGVYCSFTELLVNQIEEFVSCN